MPINLIDNSTGKNLSFTSTSDAEDSINLGYGDFDPNAEVYVKTIEGGVQKIRGSEASNHVKIGTPGFTLASDEDVAQAFREERFKGPVQTAIGAGISAAKGATLGMAPALAGVALELATPKGSPLASNFQKAIAEREKAQPVISTVSEIGGMLADPIGIGKVISGVGNVVGKTIGKGLELTAESALTPSVIGKALGSNIAKKTIEKGTAWGSEGALYGAGFETGRQLEDGGPLNAEAIIDSAKHGALEAGAIGAGLGAGGAMLKVPFDAVKNKAKKYIDNVVNSTGQLKGETKFSEMDSTFLEREKDNHIDPKKRTIKGTLSDGVFEYNQGKTNAKFEIDKNAKGLDLNDRVSADEFGNKLGIEDLGFKHAIKGQEKKTFLDFIDEQKRLQVIENEVNSIEPYLTEKEKIQLDTIKRNKEYYISTNGEGQDKKYWDSLVDEEYKIYDKHKHAHNFKSLNEIDDIVESNRIDAEALLDSYDYVKGSRVNKQDVHILNEKIIPEKFIGSDKTKGGYLPSYEGGKMAKQMKMTPSAMRKMGGERLNEVAKFIFDSYPKEGNFFSRGKTEVDVVLENILKQEAESGAQIGRIIERTLNSGGTVQNLTNLDIAKFIEHDLAGKMLDPISRNPKAGFASAYAELVNYAQEFRNNGYVQDQWGRKIYKNLDVAEIKEIRGTVDKLAKYDKDIPTSIQKNARDLRTFLEDKIMGRVEWAGADYKLINEYKQAKKTYGLSQDAKKIVEGAVNKASKDQAFSMFYGGVGATLGGSLGGGFGSIAGGIIGSNLRSTLQNYSGAIEAFAGRHFATSVDKYEKSISRASKNFFSVADVAKKVYIRMPKDNEEEILKKDYNRYSKELSNRIDHIKEFMDENQELYGAYPVTSQKVMETMLRARDFLLSKIPKNPYQGNPFKEKQWAPSSYEMDKYMRFREVTNRPSMILEQISNGYLTPEASIVLTEVYPETKNALLNKFIEHASKGHEIPIEKRVEIYKIFGIKLDSFMDGKGFIELQSGQVTPEPQDNNIKNTGNVYKGAYNKKEKTLGNSTVE